MKEKKGIIYSIQRYCIHDGPGIRTTVFLKGCQLRCPWCANPESQKKLPELGFYGHKCIQCKACIDKCPQQALDICRPERIDREKCNICGLCERYCSRECYQIFGEEITAGRLLDEVMKDVPFYRNSNGGVTVSGGEPTQQPDFLITFLSMCKEKGLDTALESNAYAEKDIFRNLAPYVDHFLLDIKHMDTRRHEEVIGVPNEKILENIRMLIQELGCEVSLRIPVIPGFNDTKENFTMLGEFARTQKERGRLHKVNLLPYHSMGKSKYQALAKEYSMDGTAAPEDCTMEYWKDFLETQFKIPAEIGG